MLTESQKELLHYRGDPENATTMLSVEEQMKIRVELVRLGLVRSGKLTEAGWEEYEYLQGQ